MKSKERKIDNYARQAYLDCPALYNYRLNRHLVSPGANIPAEFGIAIHYGLKENNLKDANKAFVEYFRTFEEQGLADKKRNLIIGTTMLEAYYEYFKDDPTWFDIIDKETVFTVHLHKNILFEGRIDRVTQMYQRFSTEPTHTVIDHKTTSFMNSILGQPNAQIDGYLFGCSEMLGKPVLNAILDIILVTSTVKHYENGSAFKRLFITRTPKQIEKWKQNTIHICSQIEACEKSGIWVQNPGYCTKWFKPCEYHPLCIGSGNESDYEKKVWSPYHT